MVLRALPALTLACLSCLVPLQAQKYASADGRIRVALAMQPFSPSGLSKGPTTMAEGGIRRTLTDLGAVIGVQEVRLTPQEDKEYGGWKRLGKTIRRSRIRCGWTPLERISAGP